jgi:hypothetical protein
VKKIILLAALLLSASHAASENAYSPNYFIQLSALGLEREAFLYALTWAGKYNTDAETAAANALIEGIGVEVNPEAAIAIVCRSKTMPEFDRRKVLVQANLRLVGQTELPIRCNSQGE